MDGLIIGIHVESRIGDSSITIVTYCFNFQVVKTILDV